MYVNQSDAIRFSSTAVSQFAYPVPRYPQEMDGLVNMITFGLVFSDTDLAVPGGGPRLEFTRYYSSAGLHRSTGCPLISDIDGVIAESTD